MERFTQVRPPRVLPCIDMMPQAASRRDIATNCSSSRLAFPLLRPLLAPSLPILVLYPLARLFYTIATLTAIAVVSDTLDAVLQP